MKNQLVIKKPALNCLAVSVMFVASQPSFADENLQTALAKCAEIGDNVARLVCYDQTAGGDTPDVLNQKRPVDLTSTIKSTVAGNPQVVFSASNGADSQTDVASGNHTDFDNKIDNTTANKVTQNTPSHPSTKLTAVSVSDDANPLTVKADDPLPPTVMLDEKKSLKDKVKGLFVTDEYKDNIASSTQGDVLTEIGVSKEALDKYTPLSLAFDLDKNSERGLWTARPHYANYILPYHYNTKPNYHPTSPSLGSASFSEDEMRKIEVKYQLSLKTKAAQNLFGTDADLWIGYTQQSHWQTYNENNSRPFRAHDYQPEVFLTQPVVAELPFNGKLRMLGVGAIHHSNGESDPVSRSWNRLYAMGGAEWGKLTVVPSVWISMPKREGSKESDNPDLTDYYGFGNVKFLYRFDDGKNIGGTVRLNPLTGKGAVQLDYVKPIGRGVSGYAQVFHGYGQNLIDYNHEATSFGVGVMLNDWMGL